MRPSLALVRLAACGSDVCETSTTSAPALAGCVQHGLAGLDLSGAWVFGGTSTTTVMNAPDMTTSEFTSFEVDISQSGCSIDVAGLHAKLDDTNASGDKSFEPPLVGSSSVILCANADGTLQMTTQELYDLRAHGGDAGAITTTGTLQR